ncbi:MAG: response regulator [Thermodesulfobacteriota bacterium]
MRILIVDDATTARIFAERYLNNIGFHDAEFIHAVDGEEGLEKAREKVPDFILTDLIMPVMDGEELLKELKADPALQHIPVLVMTSAGNDARIGSLLGMGASNVLAKPFSSSELYKAVKEVVDGMEEDDEWGE